MADVIIVLGGGVNCDGGLTAIPKKRVEEAVRLYHEGKAFLLLMSGKYTDRLTQGRESTEARAMQAYAERLGVPSKNILLEQQSQNTEENAKYALPICQSHRWTDIIILTSDFHIARTKVLFHTVFGPTYNLSFQSVTHTLSPERQEELEGHERRSLRKIKKAPDLRPHYD